MAAQGLSMTGTQTPPQSAPPVAGSHSSSGLSTQENPVGHGTPAIPPQKLPTPVPCALLVRPHHGRNASAPPVSTPSKPRRDNEVENVLVQPSNRSVSTGGPSPFSTHHPVYLVPVNAPVESIVP
jgi:hypothetical protein